MQFSKKSQQGYLMVDHRASPGIPADIARSIGYDPALAGEGKLLETMTLTCAHCKQVVVPNPLRARERASCPKCNYHYVCDFCAMRMAEADYTHIPYDKFVEDTLTAAARNPSLGSPRELLEPPKPTLILPPDSKG